MSAVEQFETLRQSRLATFDRCALSSYFEERYESGWSTHPQARGTIFHRFAKKFLLELNEQDADTMPPDAAIALLDECLRQHDIDQRCPDCGFPIVRRFQGEYGPRIVCDQGHEHGSEFINIPFAEIKDLRWVVVKFANDNAFDIANLVDVEQRIRATLRYPHPDGGWVERILTGQLDALFVTGDADEIAVVFDWKDTWGIPGPSELGFDGYFQQRFYAWLIFKEYPTITEVVLREFYPRFSDVREARVYRADMADVEAELRALVERFDRAWTEQIFPPSPGHHCHFCPRPGACPIFPGVRGVGMITDEETADRIGREMTVAEAALKVRREAMSAWTSVHGPREVSAHKGRRAWMHKPSTRTSRPKREQLEQALANARRGAALNLDTLYETKAVSRFGLHELIEVPDEAVDAQLSNALEASLRQHGADRPGE